MTKLEGATKEYKRTRITRKPVVHTEQKTPFHIPKAVKVQEDDKYFLLPFISRPV